MLRQVAALALSVAAFGLSGCIAFPRVAVLPKVNGRVISAVDNTPLPNALVTRTSGFYGEVMGHGRHHILLDDYRVADADGRFCFPRKTVAFMHVAGILPFMRTELGDDEFGVYASPRFRGQSGARTPAGETVLSMHLDEMQTGEVRWPITPKNVAVSYLAYYESVADETARYLREPHAAKHPHYQRLVEFHAEMERKAAEWRERLKTAQDSPVLEHPPPP
jgi:hypothetical protein